MQPRHHAPSFYQSNPSTSSNPAGIPDPDAPPFTLLSTPVYSLSTRGADGGAQTLNIITYASPIALRPQRKYALGLYIESLTWQNVRETGRAVLQILQQCHSPLVPLLGKRSGRDVDKLKEVKELGFEVTDAFGLPVLAGERPGAGRRGEGGLEDAAAATVLTWLGEGGNFLSQLFAFSSPH